MSKIKVLKAKGLTVHDYGDFAVALFIDGRDGGHASTVLDVRRLHKQLGKFIKRKKHAR